MPQTLFERATNNIGIYIYSIRQNETKVHSLQMKLKLLA